MRPHPTTEIDALPTVAYTTQVVYDRETRDFAMYLDGELVGFARTPAEAEATLSSLVTELLERAYGRLPETA